MANICCTDICIKGPAEELQALDRLLRSACGEKGLLGYPRGESWIGRILIEAGICKDADEIGKKAICCRGNFCYYDYDGDEEMSISQEDAWGPQLEPLYLVCKKIAPNAQIFYTAIETSCDVCVANDDNAGKWLFDIFEPDSLPEPLKKLDYDFLDEEKARNVLLEALFSFAKDAAEEDAKDILQKALDVPDERLDALCGEETRKLLLSIFPLLPMKKLDFVSAYAFDCSFSVHYVDFVSVEELCAGAEKAAAGIL